MVEYLLDKWPRMLGAPMNPGILQIINRENIGKAKIDFGGYGPLLMADSH
jgi:hypothetical protein